MSRLEKLSKLCITPEYRAMVRKLKLEEMYFINTFIDKNISKSDLDWRAAVYNIELGQFKHDHEIRLILTRLESRDED